MQLLIGYLVALAVFLGGGYAGVQWLLTPEDPSVLAQNPRTEPASARLVNAKKIRDARALHRKQAETLADAGSKPGVAPAASEAGEAPPSKMAERSDTPAAPDRPLDAVVPDVPAATVAANDPKLDAKAEVAPLMAPEKIKPVPSNSQPRQGPAGKSDGEGGVAKKPVEAKAGPASEPTAAHGEAATNKKQAAAKKKRVERIASSSRKPVMMILRTIEFPDGHREQRLLPMAQARARLPQYGSISAFADDDDF